LANPTPLPWTIGEWFKKEVDRHDILPPFTVHKLSTRRLVESGLHTNRSKRSGLVP
jgi:hypothetical protein